MKLPSYLYTVESKPSRHCKGNTINVNLILNKTIMLISNKLNSTFFYQLLLLQPSWARGSGGPSTADNGSQRPHCLGTAYQSSYYWGQWLECVTVVDYIAHSKLPQKCVYVAENAALHWRRPWRSSAKRAIIWSICTAGNCVRFHRNFRTSISIKIRRI